MDAGEIGPGGVEAGNNRVVKVIFGFQDDDVANAARCLRRTASAAGGDHGR